MAARLLLAVLILEWFTVKWINRCDYNNAQCKFIYQKQEEKHWTENIIARNKLRSLNNNPISIYTETLMKSVDELLGVVKKKFPLQASKIEDLYEHDKDFRALCTDYFACVQGLSKYKKLSHEGQQSVKDYENVLTDLEKELQDFIFE